MHVADKQTIITRISNLTPLVVEAIELKDPAAEDMQIELNFLHNELKRLP